MYRAVIISCLIAVGCAEIVSPVYHANRETRQATTASTNLAQNNNSHDMQGFPSPTPPTPTKTSLAATESPSLFDRLKLRTYDFPSPTPPTPTKTSIAATESPSFFDLLKLRTYDLLHKVFIYSKQTTSNYLLQALGAVFITTSTVGVICQYTSVCTYLELAALEFAQRSGGRRRRRMAHSYSPVEYPYLNELTEIFMRAMDNYALDNVKQTREVGQ